MVEGAKIYQLNSIRDVVVRISDDLNNHDCVLLFAHNGTGKTRLSMEFKEDAKRKHGRSTLYFNAFTEDLFWWDNDLDEDANRYLRINSDSAFFEGFKELALEEKIFSFLEKYANFDFRIDYDEWKVVFSKDENDNIKVSRGEENIFVWCMFLAIYELAIDGHASYDWVKNVYIDDPVSSLDDNNAIAVAVDLAQLVERGKDKIGAVVSTHHTLFHNVFWNEIKNRKLKRKTYFYHRSQDATTYTLRWTDDTPFFNHVAQLAELKQAVATGDIYTYHFNVLRSIMEKTAVFFGQDKFQTCIQGIENEALYERAVQLMSHGRYSIYDPRQMGEDNKDLFRDLLTKFLARYEFALPEVLKPEEAEA
ncbi:AAA family ATPase [Epibacterium sp. SM1979]|uniref:AAA family ATPase n=1 Tax=Tritonibacter litoralis TaxID=2662264 RepID=A0A843YF37_9RHOB|nr:AAA family ATPase [Tritonibacter litoralis]MQQ09511.1 AAA family ATPase [Tritonibacter litoralis]